MSEKIITIFGTSKAEAGDTVYRQAYEVGRLLAEAGFVIANGGYDGTMLAAAEGAAKAGGQVIGVTCSAFKSKANQYISREIVTDSLQQRLEKLVELGTGYVVLAGGTGTLLELAMVWELKNKGFIEKDKPIILTGAFWEPLVELIEREARGSGGCIERADRPQEIRDLFVSRL